MITSGGTSTATSTYYDTGTMVAYDSSPYVSFTTGTDSTVSAASTQVVRVQHHYPSLEEMFRNKSVDIDFATKLKMKDGSIIRVDTKGNFQVDDKNAKVIYKGNNIREFNRYINASDIIEEFIRFLGQEFHVNQEQILQVPLELLINFLILRASEEDGDSCDQEIKRLSEGAKKNRYYNRCKSCGRFISKKLSDAGINFCNSEHYQQKLASIT